MKVEVDEDLCICSTRCEQMCPELFQVVGSVAEVQADPVPPGLEDKCREAARECPAGAINILEG